MRLGTKARQPVVGLALAAAAGIVCAEQIELPLWPLLAVVLVFCAAIWWWKASAPVLIAAAAAFALLHTLQHRHEPARLLSQQIGAGQQPVVATGIVREPPEAAADRRGHPASRFRLELENLELRGAAHFPAASVLVRWLGPPPAYGDRVEISGSMANLRGARNPGEFDFSGMMQREGVHSLLIVRQPNDAKILGSGHGNPVIVLSLRGRAAMQRALALGLEDSPEIAGLIQNIVLGLKHETPEAILESFKKTGTLHVLVVSGLHVGMFALIALTVARLLQCGRRGSVLITIPILILYVLVTGPRPSSIRATIMAVVLLSAVFVERPPLALNSLAAAAVLIFLWDTQQLFMPGFQFSFAVVLAIILFSARVQRLTGRLWSPDPFLPQVLWRWNDHAASFSSRHVAGLLSVSFAAWIGSLFFTARFFHLISPSALIANLFIVVAAFAVIALGISSLLAATFSSGLAALLNNANWLIARAIVAVVEVFAELPGGHAYIEPPALRPPPACELTIFDLGGGGAIHLRASGRDWLIDTGSAGDFERIILPYLRSRGVGRLDALVISHGDTGHIGGAILALDQLRPRAIVDSSQRDLSPARRALHGTLAARRAGKGIYWRGDVLRPAPDVSIGVLYPPPDIDPRAADDKGLVLQVAVGGSRVLLIFDAGFGTERWLLENEPDLRADVLVRGVHASDVSGLTDFIDAVDPRLVVVACADFPESARLPAAWAGELQARGIELVRQDQSGAVRIAMRAHSLEVLEYLPAQDFRRRSLQIGSSNER